MISFKGAQFPRDAILSRSFPTSLHGVVPQSWLSAACVSILRARGQGEGVVQRLALWLSWRIGAAAEGGEGHGGFVWDVTEALAGVADLSPVVRGCAAFHLWRSLDERPEHLRGLEAAVLGARLAVAGQGGLGFLPLALTGFGALTASGDPERRLGPWVHGAHRAVLAALLGLERLAAWRDRAEAATADLSGRTPARLIAALAAQPMLGAAQAGSETGSSRAAVLRNLDLLVARELVREVTGQGRFRV